MRSQIQSDGKVIFVVGVHAETSLCMDTLWVFVIKTCIPHDIMQKKKKIQAMAKLLYTRPNALKNYVCCVCVCVGWDGEEGWVVGSHMGWMWVCFFWNTLVFMTFMPFCE